MATISLVNLLFYSKPAETTDPVSTNHSVEFNFNSSVTSVNESLTYYEGTYSYINKTILELAKDKLRKDYVKQHELLKISHLLSRYHHSANSQS